MSQDVFRALELWGAGLGASHGIRYPALSPGVRNSITTVQPASEPRRSAAKWGTGIGTQGPAMPSVAQDSPWSNQQGCGGQR